jgi:UDP-glucose 4-epimerase
LTVIERETGLKMPLITKPRRAGDPPILVADPSAARNDLGFVPRCSDIATIVKSAWAWHQSTHPRKTT